MNAATNTLATIFARQIEDGTGNCILLHEDGTPVTRLDGWEATQVYPVGSSLSAAYDHPGGIVITDDEVVWLGIEIED